MENETITEYDETQINNYLGILRKMRKNIIFSAEHISKLLSNTFACLGQEKGAHYLISNIDAYVEYDAEGVVSIEEICELKCEKGEFILKSLDVVKRCDGKHEFGGRSFMLNAYANRTGKNREDVYKEVFGE